jgi:hypothetical protein
MGKSTKQLDREIAASLVGRSSSHTRLVVRNYQRKRT